MKKLSAVVVIVLAFGIALHADVYIKSKTHSDPISIMGQSQPAKDGVTEQWISDDAVAMNMESMAWIIDLKNNKVFIINHAGKTYVETTFPLDMSKIMPPQAAQMMGMMKATVTVTPNGQAKQIGVWNCQGFDATISMAMMTMKMSVWATAAPGFDYKKFMEKAYGSVLKAQSMFFDDAAIAEMKKINGLPILTETTGEMMGAQMRSTSEVVEIANKPAPAGVYAVPAGYTKTETLSMQDLQRR
jgi:Domain of unknown function (DUF4412)